MVILTFPSAFISACPAEKTELNGKTLKTIENVETWQVCGEECKKETKCLGFAYMGTKQRCYLLETITKTESSFSMTSGLKGCVDAATTTSAPTTTAASKSGWC